MNRKLLGMFWAFGALTANAADFYVDARSLAETPDGTLERPYTSIKAAVDAANAKGEETGEATFVYIRSLGKDDEGRDIPYVFDDLEDLVLVTATNMTITSWGEEKPLIELAPELGQKTEVEHEPNAITLGKKIIIKDHKGNDVGDSIDLFCDVKNLRFRFHGKNHDSREGNSLGNAGKVIRVNGRYCSIDGCEFFANGTFKAKKSGKGVVGVDSGTVEGSRSEDDKDRVGVELEVKNCLFDNIKNMEVGAVCVSSRGKVYNNVFKNCDRVFYAVKQSQGGYFVSNKVVNLSKPFSSQGEGYGETSSAELAYNIFVFSDAIDFFSKDKRGFTNTPKIHHNTIVGAKSFIKVQDYTFKDGRWTPWIFDNLIVLSGESCVITENDAGSTENQFKTSFKDGSFFKGNVYLADTFNSHTQTGTKQNSYDLTSGLNIGENYALSQVPVFLETEDVFSDDFYRLNSVRYPWVVNAATGADGYEKTFVGALEPVDEASDNGEFFQIDSFTFEKLSDTIPMRVRFNASYSQNLGDVASYWDKDGDGIYETESPDSASCEVVYEKGGVYEPQVKLVDSATGKEVFAILDSGSIKIKISNVYVDSQAQEGGCGTFESPVRTIQEGVEVCAQGGIVHIRGGDERIYMISNAEDAIKIYEPNVTIKLWGEYGTPSVVVGEEFAGENVVYVPESALGVKLVGLEFISASSSAHILDIWGNNALIESCVFKSENAKSGTYAVYAHAWEGNSQYGGNMTINNCRFTGNMNAVHCGKDPVMTQNQFEKCAKIFYPLKGCDCDFSFVSNKLYDCESLNLEGGNYGEIPRGEISYNRFVTTTGKSFLKRSKYGFIQEKSLIHHNTVVGSTSFAYITQIGESFFTSWCPQIYDNLIILGDDGFLIKEDGSNLGDANSSFETGGGAKFFNNVYLSSGINTGTATQLDGYDLSKGLTIENNRVLTEAPRFISTDPQSPDFCRLKARKGDWPFAASSQGHPSFVGAVEPLIIPDGFSIFIR